MTLAPEIGTSVKSPEARLPIARFFTKPGVDPYDGLQCPDGPQTHLPAHPEPVEGRAEPHRSAHGSTGSPRAGTGRADGHGLMLQLSSWGRPHPSLKAGAWARPRPKSRNYQTNFASTRFQG